MARYDTILDTIGNTPLVRLGKLAPPGVNVYAKLESFNPLGSVKDRMARAVIEAAERAGTLAPGQTVVEATSGNTGIGLAMVCAQKGYPLVVVMAENFSIERRKLLRFLGAKVVLTPAAEKGSGMLAKAVELAEAHGWFLCRQFENPANAEVHMRTTAKEILADFAGETLHCFVTGTGTGGTLLGVGRVLRQTDPRIRIVVAEPDNAPILASGIPQPRDATGKASRSHPHFQPHLIQGWTPDFIPRLTETARDEQLVDEIVPIARQRSAAPGARTRDGRRHSRRPVERRDARRRARRRATQRPRHQHRLHAARHGRALHVDAAVRTHPRNDGRRRSRDLAFDAGLSLRSRRRRRRFARCPAQAPLCRRTARRTRRSLRRRCRARQARRAVRAGVVRVLLGGAQVVRTPGDRIRKRRPGFGRVPAGRSGRENPRGAARQVRADDPADLHRRQSASADARSCSMRCAAARCNDASMPRVSLRQEVSRSTRTRCYRTGCTRARPA